MGLDQVTGDDTYLPLHGLAIGWNPCQLGDTPIPLLGSNNVEISLSEHGIRDLHDGLNQHLYTFTTYLTSRFPLSLDIHPKIASYPHLYTEGGS